MVLLNVYTYTITFGSHNHMVSVHPNRSEYLIVSVRHFNTSFSQVAAVPGLCYYFLAMVIGYRSLTVPVVQVPDNVFHFSHLACRMFPFYLDKLT